MVRIILTLLVLWLAINAVGPYFDDACILGRISEEQAKWINRSEWDKHPGREARAGDRILNGECSELSRRFFRVIW